MLIRLIVNEHYLFNSDISSENWLLRQPLCYSSMFSGGVLCYQYE